MRLLGRRSFALAIFIGTIYCSSLWALDVTDTFSISASATGSYQWFVHSEGEGDDEKDGYGVLDLSASWRPWKEGEFYGRASFAKGNGIKGKVPFVLSPNADDLEDDLKNINGHKWQDHLQELWYSHTFPVQGNVGLKITGGIIDATAFIDDNAYANDELEQFMNEAFVNNPIANLPSYDLGGAVELSIDKLEVRGVIMTSKNDEEDTYGYFGLQVGYTLEMPWGKGNYRLYGFTTTKDFPSWEGGKSYLRGFGVSADQEIVKDLLGAFFRAGWQDDDAVVDYDRFLSFGLNIKGSSWGRSQDEIGIGYGYLHGPSNSEVSHTNVLEGYVKLHLFEYKGLFGSFTVDFQYLNDNLRGDSSNEGYIWTLRFNMSF